MDSEIIRTENIYITRNSINIISGIDWKVKKSEHWVVCGANGSGKTSLLRSVVGDLWPTTGSIRLFGSLLGQCDLPKLKKRIGWVGSSIDKWLSPAATALELTVAGLYSTYELYRQAEKDHLDQAAEVLSSLNCQHIIDRPFGKLSQGEKQKVRLARSLVSNPQLLILDEVCAGLDIGSREDLIHSVEGMKLVNTLYVTHHSEEIPRTTTHAIILKDGRVLAQGEKRSTITSANLSQAFGVDVTVDFDPSARIWTRITGQTQI